MKVLLNPTEVEKGRGLSSYLSWGNMDAYLGVCQMFGVDPRKETLTQVEITEQGIVARFDTIPG